MNANPQNIAITNRITAFRMKGSKNSVVNVPLDVAIPNHDVNDNELSDEQNAAQHARRTYMLLKPTDVVIDSRAIIAVSRMQALPMSMGWSKVVWARMNPNRQRICVVAPVNRPKFFSVRES